jgi:hypothetical protein
MEHWNVWRYGAATAEQCPEVVTLWWAVVNKNGFLAARVCDVAGDREMRAVTVDGWPFKVETAG